MSRHWRAHLRALFCTPEWLFAWLGSLAGVLYLLAAAPFSGLDEHHHFFRAYQISEGILVSHRSVSGDESGGVLPISVIHFVGYEYWVRIYNEQLPQTFENMRERSQQELNPAEREFIDFRGAALYSPVPYIGQAAGIAVGRLFELSPLWLFYLARLGNLVVALGLLFLAIKITPFFKWVLLALALSPTTVFQMATLSADSLTNSFACLLIALVLAMAFDPSRQHIAWGEVALLCLVGAALTLCKQGYVLLLLLYFLIPRSRMGGILPYALAFVGLAAAFVLPAGVWALIVQHAAWVERWGPGSGISSTQQVQFILANPRDYLTILLTTFGDYRPVDLTMLLGRLGRWMRLDLALIGMHLGILFGLALLDGQQHIRVKLWHKVLCLSIIAANVLIIYTLGYIVWNPVGHPSITGIQPRYFIPFVPLVCLLFYQRAYLLDLRKPPIAAGIAIYLLALTLWSAWLTLDTYFVLVPG
jgi:uncharacterized membrane protein